MTTSALLAGVNVHHRSLSIQADVGGFELVVTRGHVAQGETAVVVGEGLLIEGGNAHRGSFQVHFGGAVSDLAGNRTGGGGLGKQEARNKRQANG